MKTPRFDPLAATATALVVAAMAVFSTYRLVPVDVPWHLATGRWILEHGFMTTNTFSWTHPDHPLYQQYPLFQVPLALIVDGLGWEAGSLFFGALWTGALVVWMRWGAPLREASGWPLLWLGAAVGLQRHCVQRPEALTILLFGLLLLALDRWRTHGDRRGLVAAVGVQWMMANSHQLFPLGLVVQFGVFAQLLAARTELGRRVGLDPTDADRPVAPMGYTLLASVAVLMLSPLGPTIYAVPLQTISTVLEHGQGSGGGSLPLELGPVWGDPIAAFVTVTVGGWFLLTTARSRGQWRLDEVGTGLIGLLMTLAALRGISFLGVCCAAASVRMARRLPPLLPEVSVVHAATSLSAIAVGGLLAAVTLTAPPALFSLQSGLGKAHGGWGEDLCTFLTTDPPPGEPINLGWAAGNPLIGCVFPTKRVFVDPRFEAYPRDFLWEGTQASEDPALLQRLLKEWSPSFAVVELRLVSAQTRLGELVDQGWGLVHVDAEYAVLTPPGPYLQSHPVTEWAFAAPVDDFPVLRGQQLVHHAALVQRLGVADPTPSLAEARAVDHPAVTQALREFGFD